MTERYTIFSEAGDEYRLQFTTERSNIIADRILDCLLQDGIEVVFYFHVIYHKEHEQYAKMIADGHHEDFDKPE